MERPLPRSSVITNKEMLVGSLTECDTCDISILVLSVFTYFSARHAQDACVHERIYAPMGYH